MLLIYPPPVAGKAYRRFPGNICLSDLTTLRILKLRSSIPGFLLFEDLPRSILPLLSTQVRSPTTIEAIHFDFYFMNVLDVDDLQHPKNVAPERAGVDSALAGGLYPSLKTVKVRYLFRSHWLATPPEAIARLFEAVDRVFPQVSASEKIKLEISSEPLNENDGEYELQWLVLSFVY